MIAKARDLMTTQFHLLRPEMSIVDAIQRFNPAGESERQRISGMVVTDENGGLVGMLSMYDILPLIRPTKIRNWEEMDDIEVMRLVETTCGRIKATRVDEIMTRNVITVTADTHAMQILDIMIRRHIRRLPVLDGETIVGMVYLSAIFDYFAKCVTSNQGSKSEPH